MNKIIRDSNGRFAKGTKTMKPFKKGQIPWNKGLHGGEYIKHYKDGIKGTFKDRPIKYWLGKTHSIETKNKISKSRIGKAAMEKHPNWKGGECARHIGKEWKRIRTIIIKKYSNACLKCGATKKLEVHHIIPYRIVKKHKLDNLIPLCKSCHQIVEHGGDYSGFNYKFIK